LPPSGKHSPPNEDTPLSSVTRATAVSHEEQLARLQSEVQTLRGRLRDAQRLATVGTMTAMVAHEFNNILTPIINYARMARKNPALIDKALDHAADGGDRATHICHALLGMTRGRKEPQQAFLHRLILDTADAMARRPDKDAIDFRVDVPENMTVTTRTVELQQVLLNLLINARDAVLSNSGPRRIVVSAEAARDAVLLRVADNGPGVAPENVERIFEPFFSTKSDGDGQPGGHGLGLAFCREVMTDLGGQISVESVPGRGATFALRLPR